jgi:hypothetical protein
MPQLQFASNVSLPFYDRPGTSPSPPQSHRRRRRRSRSPSPTRRPPFVGAMPPQPQIKAVKALDEHQAPPRDSEMALDSKARKGSSERSFQAEMPNTTSIRVLHVQEICRYEAKDEDSVSIQSGHEVSSEILNPHRYVSNLCNVYDLMREVDSSPTEAPERSSVDAEGDLPDRLNLRNEPPWNTHENDTTLLPHADAGRLSEDSSSR